MDLLSLPMLIVENIFSFLSYDEIARNRLVSQEFNEICMRLLNRGFMMIERRHALALKSVKAQLPRRESERRYHPLARHCDILTSIETRISMLNMTYSKYIDNGICCFIPGKVIDEIRRVLSIVESTNTPPRAHEVLQELRDISSMAIEHFDDKISPAFRKKLQEGAAQPPPRPPQGGVIIPLVVRQEMVQLRRRLQFQSRLSGYLVSQFRKLNERIIQFKKIGWMQRKLIRQMTTRQRDQDANIAELKKRIEECDIKYSELTHTNQAVGGKTIAASSTSAPQPLRHFGSQIKLDLSDLPIGTSKRNSNKLLPNIKPRKPLIKLPSLSEPEPKPRSSTSQATTSSSKNSQATLAKIRGITKEIRHLNHLSKSFEGKVRRPSLSAIDVMETVKRRRLE